MDRDAVHRVHLARAAHVTAPTLPPDPCPGAALAAIPGNAGMYVHPHGRVTCHGCDRSTRVAWWTSEHHHVCARCFGNGVT